MSQVETIGNATLYLGDCREILPLLPKDAAIVTDPPYGMAWNAKVTAGKNTTSATQPGSKSSFYGKTIVGDDKPFDPMPWLAFPECIIWGCNHFFGCLPSGGLLVWVKRNDEGFGSFLSDAEAAWFNFGEGIYCFRHMGDARGKKPGGAPLDKFHPNQKPVDLMCWCIERTRSKIILDPFMGSGTTGVAAVKLGRKFIGIEIESKYFDIVCRRIDEAHKQPDMFVERPAEPKQESWLERFARQDNEYTEIHPLTASAGEV